MNLFASLVDRALGRAPVLQRRRPALFEPARNAVLTTRDNPIDSLREEQSYSEAESPAPREMTSRVLPAEPDEPQANSQPNITSTVTPRANDITILEEQPAFKSSAPVANESDETQRSAPIREQTLTPEPAQQLSKDHTSSLAPSLETIVENKPGAQVALQKPEPGQPLDEIDLVADAPNDAQPSIVNNVVVLRAIAQASRQIDESRVLKPVQQRRPTRQQMQRSARIHSQSQPAQLEAPAPPTINVTIGRVEVRASTPAKRAESARPAAPKLSLEEYLRGRSRT